MLGKKCHVGLGARTQRAVHDMQVSAAQPVRLRVRVAMTARARQLVVKPQAHVPYLLEQVELVVCEVVEDVEEPLVELY